MLMTRIDQDQAGHGSAVLLGQPQGQRATHRQPGEEYLLASSSQHREGLVHAGVPIGPRRLVALLPGRTVARQSRQKDLEPCGFEMPCPTDHGHRRAGEAVAQQHSDGAVASLIGKRIWVH